MPFSVEHVKDQPIIIIDCHNPFDFTNDVIESCDFVADYLRDFAGRYYRIIDFHEIEMTFSDLVQGLAAKTRQVPGSLRDPRIKTVLVGDHEFVKMKSESLKQEQYGGLDVPLFDNIRDAIAFCQEDMEAHA